MKLLHKRLLSLIPTPLPVGATEFEQWADSIIELAGPYADADSMKFAICSMIMHLGAQRSKVPKNYFVQSLRKVAANQVAGHIFTVIKEKQLEAQKAAQLQSNASANESVINGEAK